MKKIAISQKNWQHLVSIPGPFASKSPAEPTELSGQDVRKTDSLNFIEILYVVVTWKFWGLWRPIEDPGGVTKLVFWI